MKKRLRKKLHLKEFKESGIKFKIKFGQNNKMDLDNFMDDFTGFVEEINTHCGGGGDNKEWVMVVEINKKSHTPEELTEKIKGFLESKLEPGYKFESGIIDLWYP